MKLADKIKHFINYGRKGLPEVMPPVQGVYRTPHRQPIKAVFSIDLPIDINESEYLEKLIKDNLARKIADEITKYMKIEKRPPLIHFNTKKVEYVAEITILVDTATGGEE